MTTQTDKPKATRTRDLGRVVVQRQDHPNGVAAPIWDDASSVDLPTVADAMDWIKVHGAAGIVYRIARVGPEIQVAVEKLEKRSLVMG